MNNILYINPEVDFYSVLKSIDCKSSNHNYEMIADEINKLCKLALDMVKPMAAYKIVEIPDGFNFNSLSGCKTIGLCIITLGSRISEVIKKYFDDGDFLNGMILDAIGDSILFNASDVAYRQITRSLKNEGANSPVYPGDDDIPLSLQKDIYKIVDAEESLNVKVTNEYMFSPVKTLSFFFGICENVVTSFNHNHCLTCNNISCRYRNSGEINLTVLSDTKKQEIKMSPCKSIYDVLIENSINISSYCVGSGKCGKCKIKVLDRSMSISSSDKKLLTETEIKKGIRLACTAYPQTDCTIEISNSDLDFNILSDFSSIKEYIKSRFKILKFDINKISEVKSRSITIAINKKLNTNFNYSLNSLKKISDITLKNKNLNLKILTDGEKVIDIFDNNQFNVYGAAVDIGTTTIVICLVNLFDGSIKGTITKLNSQRIYGADVISRMNFCMNGGLQKLNSCIKKDINDGLNELIEKANVKKEEIVSSVIVGNSTMIHILLGLSPDLMASSPFTAITLSNCRYDFSEIFNSNIIRCPVDILPGISAYVGADIVSGMYKCNFHNTEFKKILIDIGTNGEMACADKNGIVCLSTAAGPAFEGANISCGTGCIKGAIYSININKDCITYKTFQNEEPTGICGSGVIDIVSSCINNGIIDSTGRIIKDKYKDNIKITKTKDGKQIVFTQKDIRELQLAKSAVRSGLDILVKKSSCNFTNIDRVYIAGGFGNNLNIDNAVNIGLIPVEFKDKVIFAGNSALGGAVKFLLDENGRETVEDIIKKTRYIELSGDNEFNELFLDNILFGGAYDV